MAKSSFSLLIGLLEVSFFLSSKLIDFLLRVKMATKSMGRTTVTRAAIGWMRRDQARIKQRMMVRIRCSFLRLYKKSRAKGKNGMTAALGRSPLTTVVE